MDESEKPDRRLPEFPPRTVAPAAQGLRAAASLETELVVPQKLFYETLAELKERSAAWRESAAIFCGRVAERQWIADRVYFHHRLCDDRGRPRSMHLTEEAKFRLYEELNRDQLRLIAAIHTHPEGWVDLSWIDEKNQLCSKLGFWSIVVPWYGREPWLLDTMGVHVRIAEGWARLSTEQVRTHVKLTE